MSKPRIIIADTDINYIIPLQLKFVEEFFEKVDLEIITDKTYFSEFFTNPQRADILIVSEELYDSSMQLHNISNIFLMTEKNEEEHTASLKINKIFKYTSVKEIFNEIIGKCINVLNIDVNVRKEPQIIMVYSASGGVGKTTVAMGISGFLTKNYKKVLYINASHMHSFQRLLDNKTPISSSIVYANLADASTNVYDGIKHVIRKEQFSYLPPFKAALMSLGLKYSLYERLISSAKKSMDYDYIVVDTDSTFNEEKARLLQLADKVVIVTEQNESSVFATNILVSNMSGMRGEKFIFVCNKFVKEKDNALISPALPVKFRVSEYIEYNDRYDQMKSEEFSKDKGIQRITLLIM